MNQKPGIYIHVPFCLKKCAYCSFYSVSDTSLIEAYIHALTREIDLTEVNTTGFDSIYFGGGTPSVLKPNQIETILNAIRSRFSLSPDMEITLEANPGTVSFDNLKAYANLGVNRINFGVQSFHESVLNLLGRIHSAQEAFVAIGQARRAGYENIGLDIMYGIPGQTDNMLIEDIKTAIRLKPEHISSYLLSYEKGSLFYQNLMKKTLSFQIGYIFLYIRCIPVSFFGLM